mgnify:CR=1 FL=1
MKRKILTLILIMSFLTILVIAGCGTTPPPAPTYIPPQTCSIMVVSQSGWVYGTVYVFGVPTEKYLPAWGSVTISDVPCGQNVPIYLVDQEGFMSNTRYVYTTPGAPNIVNFDSWP